MSSREPPLIGLTGPVGSGKSAVLAWCARQGAATFDADAAVHGVLAEPDVAAIVASTFGSEVAPDGRVDRARLAAQVFDRADTLAALEAILHPRVRVVMRAWHRAAKAPLAFVEAIKLVEAGLHLECGGVWLVLCDRDVRRLRLSARGWSPDEVSRRMAAAPPLGPELAAASVVIDNTSEWSVTESQLVHAWRHTLSAIDAPRLRGKA